MAPRGRRPKGTRSQLTVRIPASHRPVYEAEAQRAGLALGDYIAVALAREHNLAEPDYLNRPPAAQEALPLGA